MCNHCEWRALVSVVKSVVSDKPKSLEERQRDWIEAIAVTADDDHHCTDHQKAVVRRILRERGIEAWRSIPKALDRSEWSDKKKEAYRERRKLAARCRRHGGF
jgi:hypothetical protein